MYPEIVAFKQGIRFKCSSGSSVPGLKTYLFPFDGVVARLNGKPFIGEWYEDRE